MNTRVTWNGRAVAAAQRTALLSALADAAEYILQESNKIAPLDTNALIISGNIDEGINNGKPSATVFYDTPYATRVHEHPEYKFQRGREGKYLEKTFNNEATTVQTFIKNKLEQVL